MAAAEGKRAAAAAGGPQSERRPPCARARGRQLLRWQQQQQRARARRLAWARAGRACVCVDAARTRREVLKGRLRLPPSSQGPDSPRPAPSAAAAARRPAHVDAWLRRCQTGDAAGSLCVLLHRIAAEAPRSARSRCSRARSVADRVLGGATIATSQARAATAARARGGERSGGGRRPQVQWRVGGARAHGRRRGAPPPARSPTEQRCRWDASVAACAPAAGGCPRLSSPPPPRVLRPPFLAGGGGGSV